MTSMQTILNNPVGSNITGNTINNNNYVKEEPSLAALHGLVAPNAILNAGGRLDQVGCHPGTRVEVIDHVEKWRDAQGKSSSTTPIYWLTGPAGGGKSAIVQTVAERCKERGIPQANFFFFRMDDSRGSLTPLIPTLLHQLILLYPPLAKDIAAVLSADPLIFKAVLKDQLARLFVAPLRTLQKSSTSFRPPLLLIDGLDECDSESKKDQRQILVAFHHVIAQHTCPFHLLVASRDEPQIHAAFGDLSSLTCSFYLDDMFTAERDIRVFVKEQFQRIRNTHPLRDTLDATWPSAKDVDRIVQKSSGQFVYAVTVMRFLSDPSAYPVLNLTRLHNLHSTQTVSESPFVHLDALYAHILSRARDQRAVKDIFKTHFCLREYRLAMLCDCKKNKLIHTDSSLCKANTWIGGLAILLATVSFKYAAGNTDMVIRSSLADLTPITRYDGKQLVFHHASFSDYILDRSRSGSHFVEHTPPTITFRLLAMSGCLATIARYRAQEGSLEGVQAVLGLFAHTFYHEYVFLISIPARLLKDHTNLEEGTRLRLLIQDLWLVICTVIDRYIYILLFYGY